MDDLAISKNGIHPEQTEIIMYQTEDGLTKIDVRMENETVWLTQAQMAELFQRERSGITKHIKNVFAEGEVDEKSNVKNVHIANSDKPVAYYSLDVIISVGYRVKSLRGTQFRIWANSVLKEYLIKGYAMNDELLKQAGGGNYFDELMDRIRDIRSSEKCSGEKFWTFTPPAWIMTHGQKPPSFSSKPSRIKCTGPLTVRRRQKRFFTAQTAASPTWGCAHFPEVTRPRAMPLLLKTTARRTSCWRLMTLCRLILISQRCRHDAVFPCICPIGSTPWTAFSSSLNMRY